MRSSSRALTGFIIPVMQKIITLNATIGKRAFRVFSKYMEKCFNLTLQSSRYVVSNFV